MLNRVIDKLTDHWENKCRKEMGGIPMCWVIYQPEKPKPNMIFKLHPMFDGDEFLNGVFRVVADYMRDEYLEVEGEDG